MTRLCVAIFVTDLKQAKRDISTAIEAGAEIVELRLDDLPDPLVLMPILQRPPIPLILTCRSPLEGGRGNRSDMERISLIERAAAMNFTSYVDIELQTLRRVSLPPKLNNTLIISSHDFAGRPERLHNLLLEMNELGAGVSKIVWTARTIRDNLEAFEILQSRQRPTIALCMGEHGILSRILAKKFGGFLTFVSLGQEKATAPGQVSIADLKTFYRWDAIGPQTKVFGVVGSPIGHSMSPAIHNAAFDETGFDGVYVPLLVNEGYESFKAFMESFVNFSGLDLGGLSITIPHKENALRYLIEKSGEVDELSRRIGAVNTIVIDRGAGDAPARLRGMNTDYAAILDSMTAALGITREKLADYRVAVIGAGGTGRTAVAALASCGATVVIYNRTRDRAELLAAEFNGHDGHVVAAPLEKLCDSCCQIYINTTSIGMHPRPDESPFGERVPNLGPDSLVFDAVYNPPKTKLLAQAETCGARAISGVEMFVRQATAQFEAFTQLPAPAPSMRQVVERQFR